MRPRHARHHAMPLSIERVQDGSGKVRHAEIDIRNFRAMLAGEHPEAGALCPETIGASPVSIHIYVEHVDAAIALRTYWAVVGS
jgi:uncharacterized glyoxalase superfamily protein PhnB